MTEVRQNKSPPVDPLAQLTDPGEVFKVPAQVEFIRTMLKTLSGIFVKSVRTDQAVSQIILMSPAGKAYGVTVADDGTVTTALIRG